MKFSEIINDQQLATEAIRRWITIAVCIVIAIVSAFWIVDQQFFMFALLGAVAAMVFMTVGMQRSVWLLLPIGWGLKGSIHALPLPLTTRDVVVMMVTCSYIVQRVVGQSTPRSRGVLGALVLINCACFASTFLYHPVGVHALGAETMGGRPYFNVLIAWCAYWVIVHLPESYKSVVRIPIWLMASVAFSTLVSVIVYVVPSATPYVWFFYSTVDISGYLGSLNPAGEEQQIHRLLSLGTFGVMLIQVLSAYYPPRKIFSPAQWQFYLSVLAFTAILASGYRSGLAEALGCMALAAWFHRDWREIVLGGIIGAAFLGFLVFGQGRLFDLPLPMQRTLGSLPGQWDETVREQVKVSNARWDWWRQVVEEGTIKNWWIGDGVGVSQEDFTLIGAGRMGFEEAADITGSFHSGPLTTIRCVGIIGLIPYYALVIAAAVSSVKCVRRCYRTPLLPVAIFLAIRLVWEPLHFTFIYGSYADQLPEDIFLIGLLTLVWRMSERQPPSSEPTVIARPLFWNNGTARVPR
jgi:hypothetical protein